MKKVIIAIHGLGNKPNNQLLKEWWLAAMQEGLSLIGKNNKLPHVEMVYWADILNDKPLDETITDKKDPHFIDEPYTKQPETINIEDHSFRKKIIDFVGEQINKIFLNPDKTLNYSFITDAILKKYFRELEIYYNEDCTHPKDLICKARTLIRERLVNVLKKYPKHEIMIIAHSMGSIVAFDVLNFILPETKINTFITIGSPLGLPIIISKIAAEQSKTYHSDNVLNTPPGILNAWYNFADITDYIALNYKLADDFSSNVNGIAPIDFLVNNNYEVKGIKNPHKSFGYLRTPEFANILSNFISTGEKTTVKIIINKLQRFFNRFNNDRSNQKEGIVTKN